MKVKCAVSAADVRRLLDFNAETGRLIWKPRGVSDGPSARLVKAWNTRFAGKAAGSMDHYGYLEVSIKDQAFKAHRVAWAWVTGEWPQGDLDHVDGNRANNVFANLRDVPRRVNCENQRRARSDSLTGLQGVHFHKASGLFYSCIRVKGAKKSLGYFHIADDAHQAYVAAKRDLHEGCTL